MKIKTPLFIGLALYFILWTHNIELKAYILDVNENSNISKDKNIEKLKQDLIELEKTVKSFSLIFEKVAQLVGPSVVKINITRKVREEIKGKHKREYDLFSPPFPKPHISPFKEKELQAPERQDNQIKQDIGSGVIIDENGYILTNYHVIHSYSNGEIVVTLFNGKKFNGKVVGTDPKTDLAVLKIDGKAFQKAYFGDVSKMRVGDWVIAIGSPFNYQQTVSAGIISAIGRKHVNPNSSPFAYEDFIQTDASVNPGSSGGPLVNLLGEIIGVNSAIATRTGGFQGIAFAISASIAKKVAYDLIEKGKVSRGHIGVGMLNIDDKLAKTLGLKDCNEVLDYLGLNSRKGTLVARVWNNTPASQAGIIPGDVILEMDTEIINNSEDLQKVIRNTSVGSISKLIIVRDREKMPISIKIGDQPDHMNGIEFSSIQTGTLRVGFGLTVKQLTPEVAESIGYNDTKNGILVVDVEKDSIAERASIKPGDVINKVGYNDAPTILDFYKILYRFRKEHKPITLQIYSKGFVTLI